MERFMPPLLMTFAMIGFAGCDSIEYARKVDCSQKENANAKICTGDSSPNAPSNNPGTGGNGDATGGGMGGNTGGGDPGGGMGGNTGGGMGGNTGGGDPGGGMGGNTGGGTPPTTRELLDSWCAYLSNYNPHATLVEKVGAVCNGGKVTDAFFNLSLNPYTGGAQDADVPIIDGIANPDDNGGWVEYAYYYSYLVNADFKTTVDDILPKADYMTVNTESALAKSATTLTAYETLPALGGDHIGGNHTEGVTNIDSILGQNSMKYHVEYNFFRTLLSGLNTSTDLVHLIDPPEQRLNTRQLLIYRVAIPVNGQTLVIGYTHLDIKITGILSATVDVAKARNRAAQNNVFKVLNGQ